MIESGFSPSIRDFDGRSILHIACYEGKLATVQYLISIEADVNSRARRGNEPLSDAMINGHRDVVNALLQAGACLSEESNADIQFRMCQLAASGNMSDFHKLFESGASVNSQDYDLRTPLHLAACRGNLELVKYIIANGGDIQCRDRWGRTALADAIVEGHAHVQEALRLAQWLSDTLSDSEACSETGSIDEILDIASPSHPRARSMSPGPRQPSLRNQKSILQSEGRGRSEDDLGLRFTTHCVSQVLKIMTERQL